MPSIAARRQEIATALAGVSGLRPVQSEGLAPDKLNLPTCIVVMSDAGSAADSRAMNLALTEFYESIDVILIHSLRGGVSRAQRSLDALYDDVHEALVTNVDSLVDIERRGYGLLDVQGVEVLGAILKLEVIDQ